jgi:hypothetical protein
MPTLKVIVLFIGATFALFAFWLKSRKPVPSGAKPLPGPKGQQRAPSQACPNTRYRTTHTGQCPRHTQIARMAQVQRMG